MLKKITQSILDPNAEKAFEKALENLDPAVCDQRQALVNVVIEHQQKLIESPLLKKIDDLRTLLEIHKEASSELKQKLSSKISQKLNNQTADLQKLSGLIELLKTQHQDQELFLIAQYSENEELLKITLPLLDTKHRLQLLFSSSCEFSKREIVNTYGSIDELKHLEKEGLNKDKKATQLIRERIEALQTMEKTIQNLQQRSEQLLTSYENMAKTAYAPLYDSKALHLSTEWDSLRQELDKTASENTKLALWLSEQKLEENIQKHANEIEKKISEHKKAEDQAVQLENDQNFLSQGIKHLEAFLVSEHFENASIESLLESIENKLANLKINSRHVDFDEARYQSLKNLISLENNIRNSSILNDMETGFSNLQELFTSNHKRQKAEQKTLATIRKFIGLCEEQINQLPKITDFQSFTQGQLQAFNKDFRKIEKQSLILQEEFKSKFDKKTGYIKSEVENKALGTVSRLIKEAEELVQYCPEKTQETLNKRLETYKEEKNKLEDWYNFATLPKRKELCESMEALAKDAPRTKIKALKESIKKLQNEWKQLGFARDDEGKALWKRFQEAGDQAYLPVKQLIERKEEEKQKNLETRQEIISKLETSYSKFFESDSTNSIDWQACEKILRSSSAQWQKAFPLPTGTASLQNLFDELLSKFEKKLKPQRKINLGAKTKLVEQAKKTSELEDNRKAIEEIKALQAEWKNIGFCDEDDKLWDEFRAHCDSVFNQRNELRDAHKTKEKSDIEAAQKICLALENIDAESPKEFEQEINRLRSAYEELNHLPKKRNDIYKHFNRAEKNARKQLKELKSKNHAEKFNHLVQTCKKLAEIEEQIICESNSSEYEEELNQILENSQLNDSDITTLHNSLKELAECKHSEEFFQTRRDEVRKLCIELEIESDTASPAEDQPLRMEIQVQRLNKKFNAAEPQISSQQKIEQCFLSCGLFSFIGRDFAERLIKLQEKL